jgi:hypothetical protein
MGLILGSFPRVLFLLLFLLISFSLLTSRAYQSTQTSSAGLKTRHFNNIIIELKSSLRIHTACGSRLGGVSLEFTGELNDEGFSVTECIGGSMELGEGQLGLRYQVWSFFPLPDMFHLQLVYTLNLHPLFTVFLRSEIEFRAESRLVFIRPAILSYAI